MTRGAKIQPEVWKKRLLLSIAMGAAAILIGCGGGGGGGNNGGGGGTAGVCGSPAGSTTPVVCGYVRSDDATPVAIAGATVTLRDATGTQVGQSTTTDGNGFYKFSNVPSNASTFRVDPPSSGYSANTARLTAAAPTNSPAGVYLYYTTAQAGGPCIPSIGGVPNGDKLLGQVTLFNSSFPPPPAFDCPR